jgi:hypothetical protein
MYRRDPLFSSEHEEELAPTERRPSPVHCQPPSRPICMPAPESPRQLKMQDSRTRHMLRAVVTELQKIEPREKALAAAQDHR